VYNVPNREPRPPGRAFTSSETLSQTFLLPLKPVKAGLLGVLFGPVTGSTAAALY
jgi:hypothetical protein